MLSRVCIAGVFGFFASNELTTDTPGWPSTGGMNGVHDQYVALQWIKEHIRDFGGDHERVTIFGDSAGGAWRPRPRALTRDAEEPPHRHQSARAQQGCYLTARGCVGAWVRRGWGS